MINLPTIGVGELMQSGEATLQTGPFGTQLKASDYAEDGVPVINVRNIGNGRLRPEKLEYLDEKMAGKLSAHRLKVGDIVFGRKGAVDRHLLVDETTEGWIQGSDCLRLRIESKRVFPPFVSFYFDTKGHKDWMEALCSFGATMASLNQDIVSRITLPFPQYETQKKIAAILTAYDDLIENNQRRIAALEKMAEELYREWFVRLRFPGHEKVKLVKGVPEGWSNQGLSTLGAYLNGYAFEPGDWGTEGLPIIKIKEMSSGVTSDTPRNSGNDVPERYHFDDGAIIFSWSATLMVLIWDQGPGLLNQHLFKVDPVANIPKSFLYLSIKFSIPIFLSLTTGATMQHIKRRELDFVKVNVPPDGLLTKFDELVSPILQQKLALTKANTALRQTRDILLPRLISGKLRVDDLDIQLPPSMKSA